MSGTPTHGWRGFDPTNDLMASEHHVKMAVGRDYHDVLRARLNGGIRNKAARGELRRGLPVGFVIDETDGTRFFGMTCAACHTAEIEYQKNGATQRLRIDGAPAGKVPRRL